MARTFRRALVWLNAIPGVELLAVSRWRMTEAIGPAQPRYLNAVARVATRLPPRPLLAALKTLEVAAGRRPGIRWGPRPLDLDLLLMGPGLVLDTPVLTVPHPRIAERRFVLEPLADLDPQLVHPALGRTVAELLGTLDDPRAG